MNGGQGTASRAFLRVAAAIVGTTFGAAALAGLWGRPHVAAFVVAGGLIAAVAAALHALARLERQAAAPAPPSASLGARDAACAHITAGCDDIDRVQTLLADASAKLLNSFDGLQAKVARQQDIAAALVGQPAGGGSQTLLALRENADEVDRDVRDAVISLQFHDLASQLLAHTRARFGVLRQLAEGAADVAELHAVGAVSQADMASGSVELFS